MTQLQGSFQIISNPHVLMYLLKGLVFTLIISAVAVLIGIAFGSVLALVRNYCTTRRNKIFGFLASVYIVPEHASAFVDFRCSCSDSGATGL